MKRGSPVCTMQRATLLPCAILSLLSACAPIVDFDGAYFPVWILCGVIGIGGALLLRLGFVRIDLEAHLGPLPLIYGCLVVLIGCTTWLVLFRQ